MIARRAPGPLALLLIALVIACAPRSPHLASQATWVHRGVTLRVDSIRGDVFEHIIVRRTECPRATSETRFVFLDGDGAAWVRDGFVSEDPTPRASVALDLLVREPSCALYLSRPCTFGLALTDPACGPEVWTRDRYGSPVIDSLTSVLEAPAFANSPLILVGHSGGGTLAARLAARLPAVSGLITLGANLDVPGWLAHHGYDVALDMAPSPFPLPSRVAQLHVLARNDEEVPIDLAVRALDRFAPSAERMILEDADHTCCWTRSWPAISNRGPMRKRPL